VISRYENSSSKKLLRNYDHILSILWTLSAMYCRLFSIFSSRGVSGYGWSQTLGLGMMRVLLLLDSTAEFPQNGYINRLSPSPPVHVLVWTDHTVLMEVDGNSLLIVSNLQGILEEHLRHNLSPNHLTTNCPPSHQKLVGDAVCCSLSPLLAKSNCTININCDVFTYTKFWNLKNEFYFIKLRLLATAML